VRERLLPWALQGIELGEEPLEIGPGPGHTTGVLRERCRKLTCIEIDPTLAASLEARMRGANVTVKVGDATRMPFCDNSFSGVACFTMLHHVPSLELQDRLLHEAYRVLRPGAWIVGSDSRISLTFRILHIGDTMVVCDPAKFQARVERAGFQEVSVRTTRNAFAFRGRKLEVEALDLRPRNS
jgi:ubiquinone/menaquinone biosynthesis C-methylase UbiE